MSKVKRGTVRSAAGSKASARKVRKSNATQVPKRKPKGLSANASLDKALKSFKSEVRERIAAGKPVARAKAVKGSPKSEAFAAREVQVRIAELQAKAAAAAKSGQNAKDVATRLKGQLDRLKSRSKR